MSDHRAAGRALLAGNFAIGCGVMVTAGSLNDLVRSLQVSVPVGGQLISVAAVMMALGAPLLAGAVSGWDRRRLLTLALLWYAVGHALSALMPHYAALLPVRALTVLGAAVFTPQAAAAINVMAPPAERGRAITFIFIGWSLSSVIGMPLHSYIGEAFGWRWAFALVAVLSALAAAWVWRTLPDGIRPAALSLAAWRSTLTHPLLMGVVAVTALSAAGQFTLFSYFAPYYRQVIGADAASVSFLFLWFGAFGLLGNILLQRVVDRQGAARCVTVALAGMAVSLLLWPLALTLFAMTAVLVPWALGCFSSNSAQQARLGAAAPALAPALMALNTSAMYLGQAIGAGGGGAMVAASGFGALHWVALGWMLLAIGLSALLARRMARPYDV
ncbi:MFS transporter [Rubrivivax sp. RP6-9]|uniref:MFS transporter n=1 Tax=Rubrivivax sp. RP6-9 TaxID=3415750 RepID=UPI003CC60D3A